MAQFDTRFLDPTTGAVVADRITAESEDEVRSAAMLRGQTFLSAKKVGTGWQMEIGGKKRVKPSDLVLFTRMFATIIAAGLPALQALNMMVSETEHKTLREALEQVTADFESGSSLGEAFAKHPHIFPAMLITTVSAAEEGGFLDQALLSAADTLEAQAKLTSDIKQAATYPAVVLSVGIIASLIMLLWMLPKFASMFDDLGGELPALTRFIMALSNVLKYAGPFLALAIVGFVLWWRKNRHVQAVREFVDPIKLRLPIFGPISRKIAIARMTRTLSLLLGSGTTMLEAVSKAAPTANNVVIAKALTDAGEYVDLGEDLSKHLSDSGAIPTLVSQMLRAGEESGRHDEMLLRVAEFYDQEVSAATKSLSSTLEPILIVLIAAMIGVQLVAIYLPMFSIFDLIG